MTPKEAPPMETRCDVWHFDPRTGEGEKVRDLDVFVARRLVEHEQNAGRQAAILPVEKKRRTYR